MAPRTIWLITLAAYLPASSLAALGSLEGPGDGGTVDPALLTVPFCAGFGVGFLFWGALVDRYDRLRVMVVAAALMALAGAGVAFATTDGALIAARVLVGLAAAGVPPAAQALLAERASANAGGRLAGMMVAVGIATLGGPLAAQALADAGWVAAALVLGTVAPLFAALLARGRDTRRAPAPSARVRFRPNRGVLAGWATAALVLGGYWTVLTRLAVALGDQGAESLLGLVSALGALGIPLAIVAGRLADRFGPRTPMVLATAAGGLGFGLAAIAPGAGGFVAAAAVGLALYWAYLPVVAVQVVRASSEAARGRAVAGMYAAMWLGAAVAGAAATAAPSWRYVLAGAGLSWVAAALIAARGFQRGAATGFRPSTRLATQPSRA
jgi:MFS family permease